MISSRENRCSWLMACAALSLYQMARWGLNTWVYPTFHQTLPVAREVATAVEVFACLVLIAMVLNWSRAPRVVEAAHGMAPVLLVASLGLYYGGIVAEAPFLLVAGAVAYGVGGIWLYVSAAATLIGLKPLNALLAVVTSSFLQWVLSAMALLVSVSDLAGFVLQALLCLGCLGFSGKATGKILATVGSCASDPLAVFINPRAYIPASHPLFMSVVLSGLVCGMALTYGSSSSVPVQTPLAVVPLLVAEGMALLMVKKRKALDTLYLGAAICVVAGLAFLTPALLSAPHSGFARQLPNAFLSAAANCLLALALLVSGSIGRRNPTDFLRIALLYAGSICLGILGGATAGHTLNVLVTDHVEVIVWMLSAVVVVFAGYNFCLLRLFSFDEVVSQVRTVDAPRIVAPSGSFDARCRAIAEAFGLTSREAEVFQFYARGRSTAVVQEELVLSYNTVKTHVRNMYRKMDVHSQQELIDLVDAWTIAQP